MTEQPTDPTDPDPRVRVARPTDAAAIRELQSMLRESSSELLEYGLTIGTVLVSVDHSGCSVHGADSGTISGETVAGYLLPVTGPDHPGVHLAELAVAPAYRREGRARGLLRSAIADADGPVTLLVHPDNDAARSLYDEVGFTVVGRRPEFYDGTDALRLRYGRDSSTSRDDDD